MKTIEVVSMRKNKKKVSKKQRDTQTLITLLYAISCKTLSDRFRFGKVRLERFCEGMSEVLKGVEMGEVDVSELIEEFESNTDWRIT